MSGFSNSFEDAQRQARAEYGARRRALERAAHAQIAALRRRTPPLRQAAGQAAQDIARASQATRDVFLGPAAPNTGRQGNPTGYYQLGMQYITGRGPRRQVFGQDDPATQILRRDDNLGRLRARIATGEFPQGKTGQWDQELKGVAGVQNYFKNYLAIPPYGVVGNVADGFLGSYDAEFKVRDIDPQGRATVDMHVFNDSDLKSLSHAPVVGYTGWWAANVEPHIIAAGPKGGPFSPTRQDFYWTETIPPRRGPVADLDGGPGPAGRVRP